MIDWMNSRCLVSIWMLSWRHGQCTPDVCVLARYSRTLPLLARLTGLGLTDLRARVPFRPASASPSISCQLLVERLRNRSDRNGVFEASRCSDVETAQT